jgi:DNA polymerase IV (DinB-like DNA polymerase)
MDEAKRVILHIDMDHFYTAVEERQRPELRGRPVIVGADPKEGKGRGVVLTCNYEARKFGVRSAMPISRAWKLCPEAVYLRPNYEHYENVSNEIMATLREYSDRFEQWGIDEAFLDLTSKVRGYGEAEILAKRIKQDISEKHRLTCSVGIGPNKLVAKIASDHDKPDGLTILREAEVQSFLAPLPVRKLLWVGRKTEQRLLSMGVKTIGDLAGCDPSVLAQKFGLMGTQFYLMAHGIDRSEVEEKCQIKSASRDVTFEEDTSDSQLILETLDRLSNEIIEDARNRGYFFRTVTVRVRYENFETHAYSKTFPVSINRQQDLQKTARQLINAHVEAGRKIRLVGLRVSNLSSSREQKTLL